MLCNISPKENEFPVFHVPFYIIFGTGENSMILN